MVGEWVCFVIGGGNRFLGEVCVCEGGYVGRGKRGGVVGRGRWYR